MTLKLYSHPLSSFCHKVLIALYENATPFEPVLLADAEAWAALKAIWPIGKMPVLRDEVRDRIVTESSIIIEYLGRYYPGPVELAPAEVDFARQVRLRDRFFDFYVHQPMQKLNDDRRRPADAKDPYGVAEARRVLEIAYDMLEGDMASKTWAMGEAFTMADCAAAPALFYAGRMVPFGQARPNLGAYLERLMARPSYARVLAEAEPYFHMLPA
jgi:glutathione S-transferase